MSKNTKSDTETWLQIILGVLAIFAIKSLFENDRSKIISNKGSNTLSDEKKMKELDKKMKDLENTKDKTQNEIFI